MAASRWIGLLVLVAAFVFASAPSSAQVSVTTYHNDNSRTGGYTNESVLTPANVNATQFGKLFTVSVDGYVYAQPLYLSQVSIAGGTHNVLYVATEHDSVYAIDADSGAIYWQVSLLPPGGTTVNSTSDLACDDLVAEVGITGTPVIDTGTGTLYVVVKAKVGSQFVQYLHALDVRTAVERTGSPVLIQGSVQKSDGTQLAFDPFVHHQRGALLLEQGHVIIDWAAHCDFFSWHGWVMSYNASSLAQDAVFNAIPNDIGGGIWMGGSGIAADSSGNLYFSTGNGPFDGIAAYGDSVMKLGPPSGGTLPVLDYFTPFNQSTLNAQDRDLASGGVVLLPPQPNGQQLLFAAGKTGDIFVLDRTNLGKYCGNSVPACTTNDPQVFQEIPHGVGGIFGSPAYWNGFTYFSSGGGRVSAFSVNSSGKFSTLPTSQTSATFGWPSATPVVSSNGQSNGILWILNNGNYGGTCSGTTNCQELYAYDATNLATQLYSSNTAPNARDVPGVAVKFTAPIVANGKVFFGSQFSVSAYGLLSSSSVAAAPVFSPPGGTYTTAQSVTITDSTPGAVIYYTTDGSTPTTASAAYAGPISVGATQTLKAIAAASGFSNSTVSSATYTITAPAAATPTFTPAAGTYTSAQSVTISDTTAGATIYYTTNGTTPTTASSVYSAPIGVSATQTLKAMAVASGFSNSAVASATYTINTPVAATPTFTPAAGTYASAQSVTISDTTAGATIYYTTNGTTPTTASSVYSAPISVSGNTTINAMAVASGYSNSAVASATYTINTPVAATPTFTPAAGTYASAQSVAISDTTAGATIYYTTNGTTPTTASSVYSAPIGVSATQTLKAIAVASGFSNSAVASATYTINTPVAATPTFTPAAGTYASAQSVTISDTTAGATIYYTTNGTTPTTASSVYSAPIGVSATQTLKAIAVASGFSNSTVSSATYTITAPAAATPTFSPAGGTYTSAQSVTISDTTAGATIYYTTNGTTPTTASSVYSAPIGVSATQTLKAMAVASGFSNSAVASATYTINTPVAATPTFTPAAGLYASAQSVTINDTTAGATIYYTTNGSTPTTASSVYSGPISVSSSMTINAMAAASGYSNSAVASATYNIGSGTPIVNDPSGFPSTTGFSFVGGATLSNGALQLSDGGTFEARAVWYATPVNVQSFVNDFNFQITSANADGFTFTLQNSTAGINAVGPPGGQLGYSGITPSVAVKFDIFNNSSEGNDSTGIYVNGAAPTTPSVNMTSSGVTLSSGHVMHAHITYDGTTLVVSITDTVTNATFSTTKALNIPTTLGANTAYVGFTAGTGGLSAVQSILNWTYVH